MVYLDTSSLLKLIWLEEESEAVGNRVSREDAVLVSSMTELESSIQITAAHLRGNYSLARSRRLLKELDALLDSEPFERRALSGEAVEQRTIWAKCSNYRNIRCKNSWPTHFPVFP
jgi:uncharacterized protein with PIN domain